jgi:hypothetical protein
MMADLDNHHKLSSFDDDIMMMNHQSIGTISFDVSCSSKEHAKVEEIGPYVEYYEATFAVHHQDGKGPLIDNEIWATITRNTSTAYDDEISCLSDQDNDFQDLNDDEVYEDESDDDEDSDDESMYFEDEVYDDEDAQNGEVPSPEIDILTTPQVQIVHMNIMPAQTPSTTNPMDVSQRQSAATFVSFATGTTTTSGTTTNRTATSKRHEYMKHIHDAWRCPSCHHTNQF